MSPVRLNFTRVEVNAQISTVRSQIEKILEFSETHIGRHFPESVAALARSNDDNTVSSHLNTLDNLVATRDFMLSELHVETDNMHKRLSLLTERAAQFSMPLMKAKS